MRKPRRRTQHHFYTSRRFIKKGWLRDYLKHRSALWRRYRRTLVTLAAILGIIAFIMVILLVSVYKPTSKRNTPEPFPVGVNPDKKDIVDNDIVLSYFDTYAHPDVKEKSGEQGLFQAIRNQYEKLANSRWQHHLASPLSRRLVISSGQRKEEVAYNIGAVLGWSDEEEESFMELVSSSTPVMTDGKFFPGWYFVDEGASPETVAELVNNTFYEEVLSRYPDNVDSQVPLRQALIIASLLEREALSFEDMRAISGVIWNRLFIGMNLQLDATLQYAKGSQPTGPWWPVPRPQDKYIESPYNTYQNPGLPPAPIANPALEAVLAALNPKPTDCLFYFHDDSGEFHCSESYEGHVEKLRAIYGQGR